MMLLAAIHLVLAMTSSDALVTVLNSPSASGAKTFAAAKAMVEREAAQGKPLQQFVVGVTTDDKELAKKYLAASSERIRTLAAQKDNPLAWYLLSMEKNDLRLLRRAANLGNVQALKANRRAAIMGMMQFFIKSATMVTATAAMTRARCGLSSLFGRSPPSMGEAVIIPLRIMIQ